MAIGSTAKVYGENVNLNHFIFLFPPQGSVVGISVLADIFNIFKNGSYNVSKAT